MKRKVYEWLMVVGCRTGCHQRSDRSFYWKGTKFPLCARCTGILVGYILTIPIYMFYKGNVGIYFVCCLPIAVDGFTQVLGWQTSTNRRRFVTGVLAGYGIISMEITTLLFLKNLMLKELR